MSFSLPVVVGYNGRKFLLRMGPFNHSPEREFSLLSAKKAVDDCSDLQALKTSTKNLVEAFGALQTAYQSLMLENIKLTQTLMARDSDIVAAEQLLQEVAAQRDSRWWRRLVRTIVGI